MYIREEHLKEERKKAEAAHRQYLKDNGLMVNRPGSLPADFNLQAINDAPSNLIEDSKQVPGMRTHKLREFSDTEAPYINFDDLTLQLQKDSHIFGFEEGGIPLRRTFPGEESMPLSEGYSLNHPLVSRNAVYGNDAVRLDARMEFANKSHDIRIDNPTKATRPISDGDYDGGNSTGDLLETALFYWIGKNGL